MAKAGHSSSEEDAWSSLKDKLPDLSFVGPAAIKDKVTSVLGQHNPFATPIDPEITVAWLFDNTAYQVDADVSTWKAEFIAAYFVRRSGAEASMVVAQLARSIGLADDMEARRTIAHRLGPLLNQILPAKTSVINIGGMAQHTLVPSGPDGIAKEVIQIPGGDWTNGSSVVTEVEGGAEFLGAKTRFAGPEGWAVVSDIDDTIKVTLTNSALGILKTTFAEEPKVVEGMPELYKHLSTTLQQPPFWYLSASPYNLYPFLRQFRDDHYPAGTLLLKDASWMNIAGFVMSLSQNTQEYKVSNLDNLHRDWPQRKMICIGDSTQSDPEAYGEAYRKYPDWIKAIWIRKVGDVTEITDVLPGQSSEKRNKPERFEKAFQGVPTDVWHVFEDPKELYAKVQTLLR